MGSLDSAARGVDEAIVKTTYTYHGASRRPVYRHLNTYLPTDYPLSPRASATTDVAGALVGCWFWNVAGRGEHRSEKASLFQVRTPQAMLGAGPEGPASSLQGSTCGGGA